jgi:hypothetical protein
VSPPFNRISGRSVLWTAVAIASLSAIMLVIVPAAPSAGHGQRHHHKITCRGPASLSGNFALANHRKVTARRVGCGTTRRVVKRFPGSCAKAYAAQGRCRIKSHGRWRCRSRIVGSLTQGSPSSERCRHRRARIRFTVTYSPPLRSPNLASPPQARGPFQNGCIDLSHPGTTITPADPRFEIHVLGGVPVALGKQLQQTLVTHQVTATMHDGLGTEPPNAPSRIPVLLTAHDFDAAADAGLTAQECGAPGSVAIAVRTNQSTNEIQLTAAHELFHAYAWNLVGGVTPWWEESSATWSEAKVGFPEDTDYDIDLQYPNHPLDWTADPSYPYAMSRFVQFLEDRGLVDGSMPDWPLVRQVLAGAPGPGATESLASELAKRGTSLGAAAAAFWGDRLRDNPAHGPQLVPAPDNSREIKIEPGLTVDTLGVRPLHTGLLDFKLANGVQRVLFEFDPPPDGYFWGGVASDTSQRFAKDDSVSFCVVGGDVDDLKWPGHFPVTFTNGNLSGGKIEGSITIHAQTQTQACTNPLGNPACKALEEGGVEQIFGGGGTFTPVARIRAYSSCAYGHGGNKPAAGLQITRANNGKSARALARFFIRHARHRGIDIRRVNVGDVAGIFSKEDNGVKAHFMVVAVGRKFFILDAVLISAKQVIHLARGIAGD